MLLIRAKEEHNITGDHHMKTLIFHCIPTFHPISAHIKKGSVNL
jgi:hypothetical protein